MTTFGEPFRARKGKIHQQDNAYLETISICPLQKDTISYSNFKFTSELDLVWRN